MSTVDCAKTGVKNLHHLALNFDIGIYFEANGHGTVLFSKEGMEKMSRENQQELTLLSTLINQTVGDAFSDMFAIEAVLHLLDYSVRDWYEMYNDFPNRLMKVKHFIIVNGFFYQFYIFFFKKIIFFNENIKTGH